MKLKVSWPNKKINSDANFASAQFAPVIWALEVTTNKGRRSIKKRY